MLIIVVGYVHLILRGLEVDTHLLSWTPTNITQVMGV